MYLIKSVKIEKDVAIVQFAGLEPADYDKSQIERELKIKDKNLKVVFFRHR